MLFFDELPDNVYGLRESLLVLPVAELLLDRVWRDRSAVHHLFTLKGDHHFIRCSESRERNISIGPSRISERHCEDTHSRL